MLYEEEDSQAAGGVASKLVSELTLDDIPHIMDIFDEEVRKSAQDNQGRNENAAEKGQSPIAKTTSYSIKNRILDDTVNALRDIPVKLRGEDSPLADPWEEIKDQVQNGLSLFWPVYVDTMKGIIDGNVKSLAEESRQALAVELKVNPEDIERLCTKMRFRLIDRARKERIRYAPFDFQYFRYSVEDFDIYAQILERTGLYQFRIAGYSVAVPDGEEGEMSTAIIEDTMSKEEFDKARQMNWPENWEQAKA